jgi:hypothetical protein
MGWTLAQMQEKGTCTEFCGSIFVRDYLEGRVEDASMILNGS